MNIEDLIASAQKQINILPNRKDPVVSLVMPGKWGKKNYKRLFSKDPKSPVGEIVADNFNGAGVVVLFNAREVLDYCQKIKDNRSEE